MKVEPEITNVYITYDTGDGESFCAFVSKEQCEKEAIEGGCGFMSIPFVGYSYPHNKEYVQDKEFEKMTGFKTHEELSAYEKGRDHEQEVIFNFIKNWNGSVNSLIGELLSKNKK